MSYLDYQEQKTRGTFDFPIEFHHVDKSHPRYQMPFHWHIDYELLRVVSGHLSLSLNEDTYSLSAGDTALIQDGVLHGGTPTDCVYECIDLDLGAFVGGNAVCKKELENVQNHQIELQRIFRKDTQEAADPPDKTDFQTNQRQAPQQGVSGIFIPGFAGTGNGAEHGLTHPKRVKQSFHWGKTPFSKIRFPADTSMTVSAIRARARSSLARPLRKVSVCASYFAASE